VELPPGDIDPESGRARLSYTHAEALFKAASGGATLHQLGHSALTHDAEDGTSTPLLMARSGHTSIRSLAKYAWVAAEGLPAIRPGRARRADGNSPSTYGPPNDVGHVSWAGRPGGEAIRQWPETFLLEAGFWPPTPPSGTSNGGTAMTGPEPTSPPSGAGASRLPRRRRPHPAEVERRVPLAELEPDGTCTAATRRGLFLVPWGHNRLPNSLRSLRLRTAFSFDAATCVNTDDAGESDGLWPKPHGRSTRCSTQGQCRPHTAP
jgi:hypothetical protein